ncbi:thrombopoietin [Scleropages formosus]|uniref:thrombopoietin n=1 Tax=Scleropages formosus TaxID=113540 RepID=UPI0008785738|nr:thrombopoietin [Scleropages formosus]XP_018603924.1 thrombopoietin [Scleropages formosus]XP_018603925.1 thrombopoietin [Scleropages formosus]
MDLRSHLLLLLCMAASEIPDARARPADFVCDDSARRDMNKAKELEAAMNACGGSSVLPVPVQLPCAKIHKASWEIQTLLEKRAEICAALEMLRGAVVAVRGHFLSSCQSILLEQLDSSVTNHLLIVRHLALPGTGVQGDTERLDSTCRSRDTRDLRDVLQLYSSLLRGKLEWLIGDLADSCHGDS